VTDELARVRAALADKYSIEREIGAGGMATVYLAEDLKHDRRVAVKVLRPELAAALGPDRFPREIKILARLQHPHILPLLDSAKRTVPSITPCPIWVASRSVSASTAKDRCPHRKQSASSRSHRRARVSARAPRLELRRLSDSP
jgi:serine/threonine protein kinase